MNRPLASALGLNLPVLAAPMAGGAGTPALVAAAARAGGLGFLAAGYKGPQALTDEIATVAATGLPFGVNLFAPNPVPVDHADFQRYAELIAAEAERYGVTLDSSSPHEDDDCWQDKIDVLRQHPVPVVSFTFGIPAAREVAALRATGAMLIQSVTNAAEASAAAEAGMDALAVQASAAGAHSATLTPRHPVPQVPLTELVAAVRRAVDLPLIAAGGIAAPADVTAAIGAGADAVAVGTVLLRNQFTDKYDQVAPVGYPAVHHLTSPLRKAAAAAGDPERLHLWAGTGFRHATPEPAADILTRLSGQL